jgi:hypothetical protein
LYSLNQRFGLSYDASTGVNPFAAFNYKSLEYLGWYSDGKSDPVVSPGAITTSNGRQIDHTIVVGPNTRLTQADRVQDLYQQQSDWFGERNIWQIGNWPGISSYKTTGDIFDFGTKSYAEDYHAWVEQIEKISCHYKLMTGTFTSRMISAYSYQTTPFLERAIIDYYQEYAEAMPIDVFNLSINIDDGEDPISIVQNTVRAYRHWMSSVQLDEDVYCNYSNSELWITLSYTSRTGILRPSEQEKFGRLINWFSESDLAEGIIDENIGMPDDAFRLVQRWSWGTGVGEGGSRLKNVTVFNQAGELTDWGHYYLNLIPTHCPEPTGLLIFSTLLFINLSIFRNKN